MDLIINNSTFHISDASNVIGLELNGESITTVYGYESRAQLSITLKESGNS